MGMKETLLGDNFADRRVGTPAGKVEPIGDRPFLTVRDGLLQPAFQETEQPGAVCPPGEEEVMGGPVQFPGGIAMPVQIERVLGFGRSFSFWPLLFGLACCAIEMMALGGSRFDMSRFGMEAMRASPRQADGMIVAGWCSIKMAPRVVRLYEQIPDPKWVLAMGSCAISGNIWDTYNIVQGVDSLIPVDVYVPGCPPRPEALWQGLEMIRDRIKQSRHAYDGLRRIPARDYLAASADDVCAPGAGEAGSPGQPPDDWVLASATAASTPGEPEVKT
jgi:NADH-quinone oxidoreductase subunit B